MYQPHSSVNYIVVWFGTVLRKIRGLDEVIFHENSCDTCSQVLPLSPGQHSLITLPTHLCWHVHSTTSISLITNYEQVIKLVLSIFIHELKRLASIRNSPIGHMINHHTRWKRYHQHVTMYPFLWWRSQIPSALWQPQSAWPLFIYHNLWHNSVHVWVGLTFCQQEQNNGKFAWAAMRTWSILTMKASLLSPYGAKVDYKGSSGLLCL